MRFERIAVKRPKHFLSGSIRNNMSKKLRNFRKELTAPNTQFYAFAAFMALVFLTGGSSRDDVQSLIILRPLSLLFGAYALICARPGQWQGRLFPLYISLSIFALMALQLVPLPPTIWTGLPGRAVFVDIAVLAGIEQPWRPITMSPSRTLNSIFSLSIPISAIMLYLNLGVVRRTHALAVIIGFALVSALWAMVQLGGEPRGPLYLYNITNNGEPVGLFANRNHQAVFLAVAIAFLGWYATYSPVASKLSELKFFASIAAIFALVPLIFITGSRAGLLLLGPALIVAMALIYFGRYTSERQYSDSKRHIKKSLYLGRRQAILLASIVAIVGLATLSIYFSRSLAYDRLIEESDLGGLRADSLPTLFKMLGDHFPWGIGFGSFEHVYKIYEPQELLNPHYLNQAHNDWLQFPLEGGGLAIIIAIVAILWVLFQLLILAKYWNKSRYSKYTAFLAAFAMSFFLAGSVGDYPLRVPSLIAVFAVLACVFRDNVRAVQASKTGAH